MKKILKITALVLTLAALLNVCGCSSAGRALKSKCELVKESDFAGKYYSDQDKYEYLVKGFNMTHDELVNEYVRRYDYWTGMRVGITVENSNDFDVTVLGLDVKKNGEMQNTISILPRATVTMKAGETQRSTVWFDMYSNGAAYTNEQIFECVKTMGLRLIYVRADSGITSLSDAPEDALIYEKVKG